MALSAKDAIATVLAAAVGGICYIEAKGVSLGFLSSPRWAAALVMILGVGICASGSDPAMSKTTAGMVMAGLGGVVLIIGVIGLITGNKVYAEAAAALVLFMWLVATGRHLFV